MAWLDIWFSKSKTCGGSWPNGVGQNSENNEDNYKDCAGERLLLARAKLDRDGEGGREALGMVNCYINIWGGSELELRLIREKQFKFWKQFSTLLLSGISSTSVFKVRDVLHWVNALAMKTFSNIFRIISCWDR